MCMIEDADEWDLFHSALRTARKPYKCVECGRAINPGERYRYATGLIDGSWHTSHTCAHCDAVSSWLIVQCHGFLIGGVLEDLHDHWQESWLLRSHYLGRAILNIRRCWTRDGQLLPVPARYVRQKVDA